MIEPNNSVLGHRVQQIKFSLTYLHLIVTNVAILNFNHLIDLKFRKYTYFVLTQKNSP